MEGFDMRESWREGRISFMSDREYEQICVGRKRDHVALLVLNAANTADAAINKMIKGE